MSIHEKFTKSLFMRLQSLEKNGETNLLVVLPVHNRSSITEQFVDQLVKQTFQDFILLIVDDGCTDDTVEVVLGKIPTEKLIVLKGDGNLWWGGSLAAAYRFLKKNDSFFESVLIINDDVSISTSYLEKGMKELALNRCGVVGSLNLSPEGRVLSAGFSIDWYRANIFNETEPNRVEVVSTRGIFMGKSTFFESGGFRPFLLPHYFSDLEFTLRLSRMGVPLILTEEVSLKSMPLTGVSKVEGNTFLQRLKFSYFNKRYSLNPRYSSVFFLMAAPRLRDKIRCFLRVNAREFKKVLSVRSR